MRTEDLIRPRHRAALRTLAIALLFACGAAAAQTVALAELAKPGRVLMLRHANAPGTGDPPQFRLDDCATQRNLDAAGRAQARRLGEQLARAGITKARVFSSQWCRCLETARLLDLGSVDPLPALNSFYPKPDEREARMAALRAFLAGLPAEGASAVAEGKLDAVAFGTAFLANPDLPARIKAGAPLNAVDANSFYTPGPQGYTDYPVWAG